jgi:hypothetical protein
VLQLSFIRYFRVTEKQDITNKYGNREIIKKKNKNPSLEDWKIGFRNECHLQIYRFREANRTSLILWLEYH